MNNASNKKVSSNFLWRLMERFGAQFVSFVVSIFLARLLEPSVYGDIALVMAISTILEVFVDSGFANSLIQKQGTDDLDFSTVFYFNIVLCFTIYTVLFMFAPLLSLYYGKELTKVIRVLGLVIIISGVKNVQQAYVSKNMLFKKFFFATLAGTIGSAIVGIFLAYNGFGIWALVVQNLFNKTVDTIILWLTVKWRPINSFSFERLKSLFSYGWKLLAAQFVDSIYENCRSLIIGKMYSTDALGYYNKGKQFPTLVISNISTSMDSVLFPSMSSVQDDKDKVVLMLSRSIKVSSFIMIPLLLGLSVVGNNLIQILLTEKWLGSVPYMQMFCIAMIFTPISLSNLNAIKSLGDSNLYLKLEIIRKIIGVFTLLLLMWYGPYYIAVSYLLNMIFGFVVNTLGTKRVLGYGPLKQIKDIFPSIISALAMSLVVYCIGYFNIEIHLLLIFQIFIGSIIYSVLSIIIKNESFYYIVNLIFSFLQLKKRNSNEKI